MRKYLKERREKNQKLAVRDAASRCAYCKMRLNEPPYFDYMLDKKFCNEDCWGSYAELHEAQGKA